MYPAPSVAASSLGVPERWSFASGSSVWAKVAVTFSTRSPCMESISGLYRLPRVVLLHVHRWLYLLCTLVQNRAAYFAPGSPLGLPYLFWRQGAQYGLCRVR